MSVVTEKEIEKLRKPLLHLQNLASACHSMGMSPITSPMTRIPTPQVQPLTEGEYLLRNMLRELADTAVGAVDCCWLILGQPETDDEFWDEKELAAEKKEKEAKK